MPNRTFYNDRNNLKNKKRTPMALLINDHELEDMIDTWAKENSLKNLDAIAQHLKDAKLYSPAVAGPDGKPSPALLNSDDGKHFLPFFTSKAQAEKLPKGPVLLVMPFANACKILLKSEGKITGIVINPFTQKFAANEKLAKVIDEDGSVLDNIRQEQKTVTLTEAQVNQLERITFEGNFLPKRFFAEGEPFLKEIIEGKEEIVDTLFEESYKNKRMYLYLTEEFSVFSFAPEDGVTVLRINMPERELSPACAIRIYMIVRGDERYYYLIRKGKENHFALVRIPEDLKPVVIVEDPEESQEVYTIMKDIGIE